MIDKGFVEGKKNESQNDTLAGRLKEIREEQQQSNIKVRFEGRFALVINKQVLSHITNPHHDAEHDCPTKLFWKKRFRTKNKWAAENGIEYGLRKRQSLVGKYPNRSWEDAAKFGVWHCSTAFGAKSKFVEGVFRQCKMQHENMGHKCMT